jgi:ABC-type glycerol-3-phosphate transport system permease component
LKKTSAFSIGVNLFFIIISVIMLYPFWYTLVGSMMKYDEYFEKTLFLLPESPTLEAYRLVLRTGLIFPPLRTNIFITVFGTVYSLIFTAFCAYGLSKKFPGSRAIMLMIVFTMFFSGGLMPQYILYRRLGLINNILVYILPYSINTFNLIVMRTSFQSFVPEIEEAARIDGCNAFTTFFRIVLPLSGPMLATLGLFYAVSYWNMFFTSVFFITDNNLRTLSDFLYRIIKATEAEDLGFYMSKIVSMSSVKMATTILVILPILVVYPVLQKYFVKGATVGAVKG